ncbi:MAG: peptidase dimerization domain-containing protein [bacterium]
MSEISKIFLDSTPKKKIERRIIKYLKNNKIKAVIDKCGNVTAKISGIGRPLLLCARLDAESPRAGVVAILSATSILQRKKIQHRPLELVFTKEDGGAANLNMNNFKSKECLVLDCCRPLGHIIITSPYIYSIKIKVLGRATHAGSEPEKGISAIQIVAKAISELKLGRVSKSTTNNLGIINAGSAINIIPAEARIIGEARSLEKEKALEQVDLINKAFKKNTRRFKGKFFFRAKLVCSGYNHYTQDPFIKKIAATNKKLNLKTVYEKSGGASDANTLIKKRIKAVNISYGGNGAHTIKVSDLKKLSEFIVEFAR